MTHFGSARTTFQGYRNRLDLLSSRLEFAWSLRQPAQKEQVLSKFLAKVGDRYDLIVIDCAPTESILTTAAHLPS